MTIINFDKASAEIVRLAYLTEKYPPLISELPSGGIVYAKDSFFAKYGKAALKKLTSREEEYCTEPFFASRFMLNTLFESQLLFNDEPYTKVDFDDFLVADRDILILNQRLVSYGSQVVGLNLMCSNCEVDLEKESIKIENYEIERLDPESCRQFKPNSNEFFYRSPDKKWSIVFRLLTVKDERELIESSDYEIYGGGYPMMAALQKTIIALNGELDKSKIWEMILNDEFPIKECMRFQNYVRRFTPFVRIISEDMSCKQCGQKNQIRADVDLNLLSMNSSVVRDILIEEMFWLHRQLRLSHGDLYDMPLDFRKRLFRRELKRLEDEKKEMENRKANPQRPSISSQR